MENKKRAIVLDMDQTLECGILKMPNSLEKDCLMMILRPNLDKLIIKLQEAKRKDKIV